MKLNAFYFLINLDQSRFFPCMSYISNFLRIMEWLTVSKTFDKSLETPKIYRSFSKDL